MISSKFQSDYLKQNTHATTPKVEDVKVVKLSTSAKCFGKLAMLKKNLNLLDFWKGSIRKILGKILKKTLRKSRCKVLYSNMKERNRQLWHQLYINDASVDLINERDEAEHN